MYSWLVYGVDFVDVKDEDVLVDLSLFVVVGGRRDRLRIMDTVTHTYRNHREQQLQGTLRSHVEDDLFY